MSDATTGRVAGSDATIHLVIGSGGTGVSTVAAAGAVAPTAHGTGKRTLLITFDRFRSASRIFGVFSFPGQPIPVSKQVDLLELDSVVMLGEAWAQVRAALIVGGNTFAGSSIADIHPDELSQLPGIEQFLVLRRIRDEARSGQWGRIIVDCSGGPDPCDLLRVPQVLTDHLERLWPSHRRLAAGGELTRTARAVAVLDMIENDCRDINNVLVESGRTRAHLVTSADTHGVDTAHRLLAVLQLIGVPVVSVAANRLAPDGAGGWAQELAAQQRSALTELAGFIAPHPVGEIDWQVQAPRSVLALRKLGVRLATADPTPGKVALVGRGPRDAAVELESGSGLASVYRMSWRQPLPDPDTLRLGRSGDDVMVTLSGLRQRVGLPSVLRRCVVIDAGWDDGELSIRFAPDERVWPQRSTRSAGPHAERDTGWADEVDPDEQDPVPIRPSPDR